MKTKNSFKMKAIVCALVLALSASVLASSPVASVSASSLDDLNEKKAKIEENLSAARQDLEKLNATSNELNTSLANLKNDQKLAQEDYDTLLKQIEQAKKNVEVAVERYTNAVKDVEQKQTEYENRITSMFRIRNKSTLELLLESDNMQGFFTNIRLMSYMSSVDQSMLNALESARETEENAKSLAEQVKKDYESFAEKKEQQIQDVKAGIALKAEALSGMDEKIMSASSDINQLESEQVTTNAAIDSIMAEARQQAEAFAAKKASDEAAAAENAAAKESAELSASIANAEQAASIEAESVAASEAAAAREAESLAAAAAASSSLAEAQATATTGEGGATDPIMTAAPAETTTTAALTTPATTLASAGNAGSSGSGSGSEGMIYPLVSYFVSSDFGYRSDPATGETRMHWGVDFAADAGTPIRAANSGKIVIASAPLNGSTYGWANNGFGNYVSIMRADGLVIMNAHMKDVYVSQGQTVSQGEVIGTVGSTGYSTGPHLHFQIRSPHSDAYGVSPWTYLP